MTGHSYLESVPKYPEGYCLKTSRLLLRVVCDDDVRALWPLVSDPRLTAFLAWDAHRAIDETAKMVSALIEAQRSGAGFHWIILCAGEVVGLVSLIDVWRKHRSWTLNRAELAYWVGVPFWGHGFATEAAAAVVDFGFDQLKFHKLRVYHAADNWASSRIIEKLAFRLVGVERDAFQKEGAWHDLCHFEKLSSERPKAVVNSAEAIK